MGLSLRELALFTMSDFDDLCSEYIGDIPEKNTDDTLQVREATQADLNAIFPRTKVNKS